MIGNKLYLVMAAVIAASSASAETHHHYHPTKAGLAWQAAEIKRMKGEIDHLHATAFTEQPETAAEASRYQAEEESRLAQIKAQAVYEARESELETEAAGIAMDANQLKYEEELLPNPY